LQSPLRFFNGSGGSRAIAAFFLADVAYTVRVRSAITSQDRKSLARSTSRAPSSRRRSPHSSNSMMRSANCSGFPSSTQTAQSPRWTKRSEEHTSELQSRSDLVCRLLLEKKKKETSLDTDHSLTYNTALSQPLIPFAT